MLKETTARAEVIKRRAGDVTLQIIVKFKRVLDLTNPRIAKIYDYDGSNGPTVAQRAATEGYDVIKYESVQISGEINYAILQRETIQAVEAVSK